MLLAAVGRSDYPLETFLLVQLSEINARCSQPPEFDVLWGWANLRINEKCIQSNRTVLCVKALPQVKIICLHYASLSHIVTSRERLTIEERRDIWSNDWANRVDFKREGDWRRSDNELSDSLPADMMCSFTTLHHRCVTNDRNRSCLPRRRHLFSLSSRVSEH